MSLKKRIVGFVAATAFAASLVACGGGETPAPPPAKTPAQTVAPVPKAPAAPTPAAPAPAAPAPVAPAPAPK